MSYYNTCPYCGANLDPGERCDCLDENEEDENEEDEDGEHKGQAVCCNV